SLSSSSCGLKGATATDETYNTGGSISLNGFDISVPKNMLVQFPAAYVPWKNFVADKEAMLGYEVNVSGNFVHGAPIAGQILAYQFFEGLSSGYIESLNFTDGSTKIQNRPVLRISDPNAVFSVGYSGAPFFTADDESPSISSFSGFPMCIPRNSTDPLCPASNRPFQSSGTFAAPDPLSMAPFLPGDFITFMGIRRGGEMIVFSIVAQNAQITTLNDLVYVRVELGLLGIDNFNHNTELKESRVSPNPPTIVSDLLHAANQLHHLPQFVGYTSNNRAQVALYAIDLDPWVHGEQVVPGVAPPANDFSQMPWLTRGVGVDASRNLWGPLEPFPQTGVLIEAPDCGVVSALAFEGDEVKTDWVPSSEVSDVLRRMATCANLFHSGELLGGSLPQPPPSNNETATAEPTPSAEVTVSTPESAPLRKRGVPPVRWRSLAQLEATTLAKDDPNLHQPVAPQVKQ
ncbi:uncharacterized protein PG986_014166, partial [Apiospora aurea]